ncbi:MAG: MATE family efflux transporter [Oscillospiraceae bacterium]|nr:MATE family efflux transporter [Oscillospiraceae bacterium]
MSKNKLRKDFRVGNIPKTLLLFMLPFMLSNALQVFYSTVDMVIVGKYVGTEGISAVGQSSMIVNFVTMVTLGFSNAGQVLVSQALGAEKKKEVNSIIGTLFTLILLLGAILSVIILVLRNNIMDWMNIVDPLQRKYALDYLVICAAGLVFTAGYNMVSAVLRGMGDSQSPLLFIAIASVINLVLDILFIGVLGMRVAGAAWATIIGQAVSFLFSLWYLYRRKESFGFDFKPKSFIPEKKYVGMILNIGSPIAVQAACINISMLFVNAMVNSLGVVASATFSAGIKIDDIINKISMGVQHAGMPMIGQNIAAGERRRSKQIVWWSWIYSGILTVIFMVIYAVWGRDLFAMFDKNPEVLTLSGTFIKAILWLFPPLVIMRGTQAFIQGTGNTKLGMVLSLLDGVILRIGLSWLLGDFMCLGFFGYVLGYALAPYGCAIPGLIYFLSGVWEKHKTVASDI